jgi:hypothetical protein
MTVPLSWLHALAGLGRAVNGARPLDELLDQVAAVASELTGYDFAAVFTPDPAGERLVMRGSRGFSPDYRQRVNAERPAHLLLSGGPAARAFLTRAAVMVADLWVDPTFRPWSEVAREQGFRSVVCIPLLAGEPVGVLTCYTRAVRSFPPGEVTLLEAIAEQAALAIETAALRARERETIRELQAQRRLLERADDLHRHLMRIVVSEEGIEPLARAVGRMLAAPVVIEDGEGRVLAGNGQQPGDDWLSVPIARGGERIARVRTPQTGPLERRVLENAALLVALELLRERTAQEVEWRLSGDLLGDVLAEGPPADPAALLARAARLHHDLTLPHAVLVARLDAPERLLAVAARLARTAPPRALVGRRGGDVILLWPDVHDGRPDPLRLAEALRGQAPGTSVAVGMDHAEAYRVARGALDLARQPGRIIDLAEVGVERLLLQVKRPDDLLAFAEGVLGPLAAYDARRDARLCATLAAYLDEGCSTAATAERLVVHPNTVTYRLRRVTELTGLDLARPDALLDVTLALKIRALAG